MRSATIHTETSTMGDIDAARDIMPGGLTLETSQEQVYLAGFCYISQKPTVAFAIFVFSSYVLGRLFNICPLSVVSLSMRVKMLQKPQQAFAIYCKSLLNAPTPKGSGFVEAICTAVLSNTREISLFQDLLKHQFETMVEDKKIAVIMLESGSTTLENNIQKCSLVKPYKIL